LSSSNVVTSRRRHPVQRRKPPASSPLQRRHSSDVVILTLSEVEGEESPHLAFAFAVVLALLLPLFFLALHPLPENKSPKRGKFSALEKPPSKNHVFALITTL
jgi:hypothetical protein